MENRRNKLGDQRTGALNSTWNGLNSFLIMIEV